MMTTKRIVMSTKTPQNGRPRRLEGPKEVTDLMPDATTATKSAAAMAVIAQRTPADWETRGLGYGGGAGDGVGGGWATAGLASGAG